MEADLLLHMRAARALRIQGSLKAFDCQQARFQGLKLSVSGVCVA